MTSTFLIFNYQLDKHLEVIGKSDATCEDLCINFAKQIGILPSARLLFALRTSPVKSSYSNNKTSNCNEWIPLNNRLVKDRKYDFRLRFKVPAVTSTLKKLDETAYKYYYHQVRWDLLHGQIKDIKYPTHSGNVLGFGAVNMYIDQLESNCKIEVLESNYKNYIPKQLAKEHRFFARSHIMKGLSAISDQKHSLFFVMMHYLNEVNRLAPNYLIEEYQATADCLPEDEMSQPTCPVKIQVNPFHETEPGLRVFYGYKNKWMLIAKLDNIYSLHPEQNHFVKLESEEYPRGFRLGFPKKSDLDSFITCVAGYHRLSVKWMQDICLQANFTTPSLQELKTLKCHGPIGDKFAYAQIKEFYTTCRKGGAYIVRQCEKEYDTFKIDILIKGNLPDTFKIQRKFDEWILVGQGNIDEETDESVPDKSFRTLSELISSIKTKDEKFCIHPSELNKPPLLLICAPEKQLTTRKIVTLSESELQKKRGQIFDPKTDLRWYVNSERDIESGCGKMYQRYADWILPPGDFHLKVTLKILKSDHYLSEFMKLANTWSKLYSPEFIKLFGLTLSTPHTMVMEHAPYGQLNQLLRNSKENISLKCLIDVVYGLVRAVVYMQEKGILHPKIRCSNMMVTSFDPKNNVLVAKLADPGFSREYTLKDLAWIPFEYYGNIEASKTDPKAQPWAFATTVWEIFAKGRSLENAEMTSLKKNYELYKAILPPTLNFPKEIYLTIIEGWSEDPDKRFQPQLIFPRLSSIKDYNIVQSTNSMPDILSSTPSLNTDLSSLTDSNHHTISNGGSIDYGHRACGGSSSSYSSSIGSFSDCNDLQFDDRSPLLVRKNSYAHEVPKNSNQHNINRHKNFFNPEGNYFDFTPSVIELKFCKVIVGEKIGEGHYGSVCLGELQYKDSRPARQVAIKTLKKISNHSTQYDDFKREIQIMKELSHKNIVQIITYIYDPEISIIMEYFKSKSFDVMLSSEKLTLNNEKLLKFALDIAHGMEYLRSKKIIHRDLAARNILVDDDAVKISDFGLAQLANEHGYYMVQTLNREIPIKWYAPESIKSNKFSFQSDVWSYGVTLFEMFSRGETPYLEPDTELEASEFLNRLEKGERLKMPKLCPVDVYHKLMMKCWHEDPHFRPDFEEITQIILDLLSEYTEQGAELHPPSPQNRSASQPYARMC